MVLLDINIGIYNPNLENNHCATRICYPILWLAAKSSHNKTALFVMSALALAVNVGVIIFHIAKIRKSGRNLMKEEVYVDEPAYLALAAKK